MGCFAFNLIFSDLGVPAPPYSAESEISFHLTPRDGGFIPVAFDGGVQVAQILQVFDPPAEALELGMKLADGGLARLALFGDFTHKLLFDALQHTRGWPHLPAHLVVLGIGVELMAVIFPAALPLTVGAAAHELAWT